MQARSPGSSFAAIRCIAATTIATNRVSPPRPSTPWRVAGGCDFVADPDLPSGAQPVFWSPDLNPAVLVIAAAPQTGVAGSTPWPPNIRVVARQSEDGEHIAVEFSGAWVQTWAPQPLPPGSTVAVVLPLDELLEQRTRAALRLWRGLHRPSLGQDPVILPFQHRERLRLMIRALDAHLDRASYRQIAEALFGQDAVSDQPWKTSNVRQRVIRLVQAGTKLMRGGYRDLLVYPCRRKR